MRTDRHVRARKVQFRYMKVSAQACHFDRREKSLEGYI